MSLTVRTTGSADYERHIKMLVVGAPGAGKTLLSSTFKNPFYASAEGGLMSVADRDVAYADIRSSEDLFAVKRLLSLPPKEVEKEIGRRVDTVIIDTIDEIQRILIRERLAETKKETLELRDWGWLREKMQMIVRGFRNLPLNLVMTCHPKESQDGEGGRITVNPGLQGGFSDELPAYVDLAVLLKVSYVADASSGKIEKVLQRSLQTFMDLQHPWIKDRSGKLPSEFPVNFQDDYLRLHSAIYDNVKIAEGSEIIIENKNVEPAPEVAEVKPVKVESKKVEKPKAEPKKEEVVVPAAPPVGDLPPGQMYTADCPKGQSSCAIDASQETLSKIRTRKVLCRDCYKQALQNAS